MVFGVGTDPEPNYFVAVSRAERSVRSADADGVDGSRRMDLLETQAGIVGIVPKEAVCISRLAPNLLR